MGSEGRRGGDQSPPGVQPHNPLHAHHTQLDAGVNEQLLLLSRDEQSMLVASYADVKVGWGGRRWGVDGKQGGRVKSALCN